MPSSTPPPPLPPTLSQNMCFRGPEARCQSSNCSEAAMRTAVLERPRQRERAVPGDLLVPRCAKVPTMKPEIVWKSKPSDHPIHFFKNLPATDSHCVEPRSVTSTMLSLDSCPIESVNITCLFLSRWVLGNWSNSCSNWNILSMLCCQQTQFFAQTRVLHAKKCTVHITASLHNRSANHSYFTYED